LGDKFKKNKMGGHVEHIGEMRGIYRVLVGKPMGNRQHGRPRHRCKNNIKMDIQEMGCGGMDWINLAQDRARCWELVNVVINFRVP
jgi:hypothetical protein